MWKQAILAGGRRTQPSEEKCDQKHRHDIRRRRDIYTGDDANLHDDHVQQVHVEGVLARAGQRWMAQHSRDSAGRGRAPDCGGEQPGTGKGMRCEAGRNAKRGTAEGAAHQRASSGANAWSSKGSHPVRCDPPTSGSSTTRHTTLSAAPSARRPTHGSRAQHITHAFALCDLAPSLTGALSGASSPGAGASVVARSASAAATTPSINAPN